MQFVSRSMMFAAAVCCAACLTFWTMPASAGPADGDRAPSQGMRLGLHEVYFVPNQGQWSDPDVYYGLRSRGLDVAFGASSLSMHLHQGTCQASADGEGAVVGAILPGQLPADASGSTGTTAEYEPVALTVSFPGSNEVAPVGVRPQRAKFNYFVGGEGRHAASDVPSFGEVVYENLYDGIDLHVLGNEEGVLKYEFHVGPGVDWSQIRIAYGDGDGVDRSVAGSSMGPKELCIDEAGDLHINTPLGTLTDAAPIAWQESAGGRVDLAARFEMLDDATYHIVLDAPVDPARELILDPDVAWTTYLGGSGVDSGNGVAIDSDGNVIVGGTTDSTDFDGAGNGSHGGTSDVFVAKSNSAGELQWATYLGGSGQDTGTFVAVHLADSEISICGTTTSSDFEGRTNSFHGGPDDAYYARLTSSGTLETIVYLGGSGSDQAGGMAVDQATYSTYVAGSTSSTDFEHRVNEYQYPGGPYSGFLALIDIVGEPQWAGYSGGSGPDLAHGVAVNDQGYAVITGDTASPDFGGRINAFHGGFVDAFVCRYDPDGFVQSMAYLGGSGNESAEGAAVTIDGGIVVAGFTNSLDFDGVTGDYHGGLQDGFVLRIDQSLGTQWGRFFGGSGNDVGTGAAVEPGGDVYVTGQTDSTDMEGRLNYFLGRSDAVIARISDGDTMWSYYLGGSDYDAGAGIALVDAGTAVVTGSTFSTDFEGHTNERHASTDAFVTKMTDLVFDPPPVLAVNASCPSGGPIQVSWTGATEGGTVALLFARNTGSFHIPDGRPCAGTVLGLGSNQIQIAYRGSAGQNGSRIINFNTGPGVCGGFLQLVDLSACGVSNVVRVE